MTDRHLVLRRLLPAILLNVATLCKAAHMFGSPLLCEGVAKKKAKRVPKRGLLAFNLWSPTAKLIIPEAEAEPGVPPPPPAAAEEGDGVDDPAPPGDPPPPPPAAAPPSAGDSDPDLDLDLDSEGERGEEAEGASNRVTVLWLIITSLLLSALRRKSSVVSSSTFFSSPPESCN